ncbi:hypothetical protein BKA69DRAFT_1126234 [Paraphysoderma sedebokerense]|nr:hypothetical protein BKA69DRAFT_1126234 [Paraphysoderma sedebokerense]
MVTILELPEDVLHIIFSYLLPADISFPTKSSASFFLRLPFVHSVFRSVCTPILFQRIKVVGLNHEKNFTKLSRLLGRKPQYAKEIKYLTVQNLREDLILSVVVRNLGNMTGLRGLSILNQSVWRELGDIIEKSCSCLSAIYMRFAEKSTIVDTMKRIPRLKSAFLELCEIDDSVLEFLVTNCPQLTELQISSTVEYKQLELLSKHLPKLKHLHLDYRWDISPDQFKSILRHNLKTLILNASIPESTFSSLLELPSHDLPSVELLSICIDKCKDSFSSLKALWHQLPRLRVLCFVIERERYNPETFLESVCGKLPMHVKEVNVFILYAVTDSVYFIMKDWLRKVNPHVSFGVRKRYALTDVSNSILS